MAPRPPPRIIARSHGNTSLRQHAPWLVAVWLGSVVLAGLMVSAWLEHHAHATGDARQTSELRAQNEALRQQAANLQRALQINDIATRSLRASLADREEQIGGLRADLAFYSRLIGGDAQREGLKVQELRLESVTSTPHAWNVAISLTQNVKRGDELSGAVTFEVEGVRAGKVMQLGWAALGETAAKNGLPFRFNYFQQLHGSLVLPADFRPTRLRVLVQPDGEPLISRDVAWNDALAGNLAAIHGDRDAQP